MQARGRSLFGERGKKVGTIDINSILFPLPTRYSFLPISITTTMANIRTLCNVLIFALLLFCVYDAVSFLKQAEKGRAQSPLPPPPTPAPVPSGPPLPPSPVLAIPPPSPADAEAIEGKKSLQGGGWAKVKIDSGTKYIPGRPPSWPCSWEFALSKRKTCQLARRVWLAS